jgi:argininosuccinate lyase
MTPLVKELEAHPDRLIGGFTPDVFATDRALELVARGMPFRDAYHKVKAELSSLESSDPAAAIARKSHLGAPAGLDFQLLRRRVEGAAGFAESELAEFHAAIARLMRTPYPVAPGRRRAA